MDLFSPCPGSSDISSLFPMFSSSFRECQAFKFEKDKFALAPGAHINFRWTLCQHEQTKMHKFGSHAALITGESLWVFIPWQKGWIKSLLPGHYLSRGLLWSPQRSPKSQRQQMKGWRRPLKDWWQGCMRECMLRPGPTVQGRTVGNAVKRNTTMAMTTAMEW